MLAALETGIIADSIECDRVKAVFYQALTTGHVRRVAGLAAWDQTGPRYILDLDEKVRYVDHFIP